MTPEAYQEFTERLTENLRHDPRVLGLVAAGSMSRQDYQPDAYSDHDFFVIVQPGAQLEMRQNLAWLPDAAQIALAFQETAHGMKVVYENGHLLEFAVFDLQELLMARGNRVQVLLDKGDVAARVAQVVAQTQAEETAVSHHVGQFITNLLVGVGRQRRGEQLSGHKFVKFNALHHLLPLLATHLPSANHSLLDNLDATRRFELAYPELGAEINELLLADTETAARGLLALAERELAAIWPEEMKRGTVVIRQFLDQPTNQPSND